MSLPHHATESSNSSSVPPSSSDGLNALTSSLADAHTHGDVAAASGSGAAALDNLINTISHDVGGGVGAALGALGHSVEGLVSHLADANSGAISQAAAVLGSAAGADAVHAAIGDLQHADVGGATGASFWEQAAQAVQHLGAPTAAGHFASAEFTPDAGNVATASLDHGHSNFEAEPLASGLDTGALPALPP